MDSILNKIDDCTFIEAYNTSSNYTELARKIGYGSTINKSLRSRIKNKIDSLSLPQYDTAKELSLYTKEELFSRRENYQSARSSIRKNATDTYKNSDKPKCCLVCGYSKTYEVDWSEIRDKYNINCNPDTIRKASSTIFGGQFRTDYLKNQIYTNPDEFSKEKELDKKLADIRKERIKLQTANIERGRVDRNESRQEMYYEYVGSVSNSLPLPEFQPLCSSGEKDIEYLMTLADVHYGAKFVSENNEYSPEIAKERFERLSGQVIDFIQKHSISKLHIVSLGDLVQGVLRISDLKINDSNDPASTSATRIKNTWDLFAKQVKYLWTVTVPSGSDTPVISPSPNNQTETSIELLGKINTKSGNLNIRSASNSSSAKIGSYKKGELVQLISRTSNNWYRTDQGYISGEYVIVAKGKISNCTKLNMRKEPIVAANNIVDVLNVNDEVYLMKIADNGWYKVKTKDNLVGYVSNKYITIL